MQNNNTEPSTIKGEIHNLAAKGWVPIPLILGSKNPALPVYRHLAQATSLSLKLAETEIKGGTRKDPGYHFISEDGSILGGIIFPEKGIPFYRYNLDHPVVRQAIEDKREKDPKNWFDPDGNLKDYGSFENLGIAIKPSGLWVLDFDADAAWSALLQYVKDKTGSTDSLDTYMNRSGSGAGRHLSYNRVGDWTGSIPQDKMFLGIEKLELKGNGIEVVPPSIHNTGNRYEVLNDAPVLDAPQWLTQTVQEYRRSQQSTSPSSAPNGNHGNQDHPRVSLDDDSPIRDGGRSEYLVRLGGRICLDHTWEDTEHFLRLTDKARCVPPLQEDDSEAFKKVMQSARRYWEKDSVHSKNGEPKAEESGHREDQHGLPSVFNYENYRKVREQGGFPRREIKEHALVKGLSHNIFGESELGKSWCLLHFCEVYLSEGESVVFLDFENGHQTLLERLGDMGVPDELLDNFYPLRPDPGWVEEWPDFVAKVKPGLVVGDALIGVLESLGLDERDNQDMEKASQQVMKPVLDRGGRS